MCGGAWILCRPQRSSHRSVAHTLRRRCSGATFSPISTPTQSSTIYPARNRSCLSATRCRRKNPFQGRQCGARFQKSDTYPCQALKIPRHTPLCCLRHHYLLVSDSLAYATRFLSFTAYNNHYAWEDSLDSNLLFCCELNRKWCCSHIFYRTCTIPRGMRNIYICSF